MTDDALARIIMLEGHVQSLWEHLERTQNGMRNELAISSRLVVEVGFLSNIVGLLGAALVCGKPIDQDMLHRAVLAAAEDIPADVRPLAIRAMSNVAALWERGANSAARPS